MTGHSSWLEQQLPDGRKYWYNISNGQSVWEEPPELAASNLAGPTISLTSRSAAKPSVKGSTNSDIVASWRELTAANGRKYYYNAVTKVSMWEMPPEYADYLERIKDPASLDKSALNAKFLAMLKDCGINSKHSWEEALRIVFNHPHYKLVPTLAERKVLFFQYVEVQREVEREEEHQNVLRAQEAFRNLLKSTPTITSSTRYSEALDIIGKEPVFMALTNPKDRASIFEQHISELFREETEKNRQRKRRQTEKLRKLLEIDLVETIKYGTLWKTALLLIEAKISEANDEDLSGMSPIELLIGFENHIKDLERIEQRKEAEAREARRTRDRLARASFKNLLTEMETKGFLTATCSWAQLYPRIKDRAEFKELLGCSGSTPLDLFWDRLHGLQEQYIGEAAQLIDDLKARSGGESWMASEEAFDEVIKGMNLSTTLKANLRRHLFPHKPSQEDPQGLLPPAQRAQIALKVNDYRRACRKQIDRLKGLIKRFQPPIRLDSTYSEFGPLIAAHPEGVEVGDDEVRLYYFDKYIRHLRKKAGLETGGDDPND